MSDSRQICLDALRGAGDARLGQWEHPGEKPGVVHVQRRLTQTERDEFGVPEPYDIRGTDEELGRLASAIVEMEASRR